MNRSGLFLAGDDLFVDGLADEVQSDLAFFQK